MYRNVVLLLVCQAMLMTGVSLVLASSALIGAQLAPSAVFATAPLSAQYMMTMLAVVPASFLMQRYGRRAVFVCGALVGVIGFSLATIGIGTDSFLVFVLAGALIGVHNAVGQFYRFAAADAVPKRLRSRAISLTLAGGVVASLLGPNLARMTRNALAPSFTASFVALMGVACVAALAASRLELPPAPVETFGGDKRPMLRIIRQPVFIVAAVVGMLGYGTMNLLMTSTPLAMHACHLGFSATASAIQWHVLAMYAPSFVTGDLIRRFGVARVMALGGLLLLACVVINLAGETVAHFEASLVVLGIGWNLLYVGGTTLLTEAYRPVEKARVQGLNDALVFTVVALSSLASGGLVARFGWRATNVAALAPVALIFAAIGWLVHRRAAAAASAGAEGADGAPSVGGALET